MCKRSVANFSKVLWKKMICKSLFKYVKAFSQTGPVIESDKFIQRLQKKSTICLPLKWLVMKLISRVAEASKAPSLISPLKVQFRMLIISIFPGMSNDLLDMSDVNLEFSITNDFKPFLMALGSIMILEVLIVRESIWSEKKLGKKETRMGHFYYHSWILFHQI